MPEDFLVTKRISILENHMGTLKLELRFKSALYMYLSDKGYKDTFDGLRVGAEIIMLEELIIKIEDQLRKEKLKK